MNIHLHNNIIDSKIRDEENSFNKSFFERMNLPNTDSEFEFSSSELTNIHDDQSVYMTVWLRNIDRLMNLVPRGYYLNNYIFCDVGCGTGKALIYVVFSYHFKKYIGFDFDKTSYIYKLGRRRCSA